MSPTAVDHFRASAAAVLPNSEVQQVHGTTSCSLNNNQDDCRLLREHGEAAATSAVDALLLEIEHCSVLLLPLH